MIYLAANNTGCWRLRRLGFAIGWMMSPAGLMRPIRGAELMPYALDNGLFRPFGAPEAPPSERLRIYAACAKAVADAWPTPLFAVVPDVPYCGDRSLTLSRHHRPMMRDLFPSIPLAVAVQDGMDADALDGFDWAFIAGSTEWKLATAVYWADACRERGMKSHLARVNGAPRMNLAKDAGCESADGTGIWRGDAKQKRAVLDALQQIGLFEPKGKHA